MRTFDTFVDSVYLSYLTFPTVPLLYRLETRSNDLWEQNGDGVLHVQFVGALRSAASLVGSDLDKHAFIDLVME